MTVNVAINGYGRAVILSGGLVTPFRDCIEDKGLAVKPIYVHRYWRNPLDMLS